jgi:DNA-binding MarR family transcriptional regulator
VTAAAVAGERAALGPVLEFLSEWWALNHALERVSMRMQARLGVTAQQRILVRVIGRFPGITPSALARIVHLDPGTISTALRRLERAQLVERRRGEADGRRVFIALTSRGRALDVPDPETVEAALTRALARTTHSEAASVRLFLGRFIQELVGEPGAEPRRRPPATVRGLGRKPVAKRTRRRRTSGPVA